ncbi:MAG: GTPase [Chlorobiaceae bacterium]|nr:GTPase [Chlorobiaceae bacterium]
MKLVFVYNTDGNPVSELIDLGHKIISPETYNCSLCKLTHGPFSEFESWKSFRTSVGVPMEFLHRDEFEKKYKRNFEYPLILKKDDDFEVLLSKEEIDSMKDLGVLITAIKKHLPAENEH